MDNVFKVTNSKAIERLSNKSFKASKTRNLIAILAIALTTLLFTSIFTVGLGMKESIELQTIRQSGGDGHIAFKYLSEEQFQKISTHDLIKEASYNQLVADKVTNPEFLKRTVEMYYMDEIGMRFTFSTPTYGKSPLLVDEIAMDTKSLDVLGVPHKIGNQVTLQYQMGDQEFTRDFILSGYWESDSSNSVGLALVSEVFTQEYANELAYTFDVDNKYAGVINSYVKLHQTRDIQTQMEQIIFDSGYTLAEDYTEINDSTISANTNWAYMSGGIMDAGAILAMICAVLLVTLTGYLIIYNVFQISILRDIRFYGLLKTIGTTAKQLKRIVTRQALLLCAFGIPVGLLLGFFVGKAVMPLMMEQTSYQTTTQLSINPWIFIGATIFSLLTVFLSTRKPCKIAAHVSPIEAVKYTGESFVSKKNKRSNHGGKVHKMAFSNLLRTKKRVIISIFSLSLSLVLLNTVYTIAQGFDMDKYLAKFVDTDFLVGHANYFNMEGFHNVEDETSQTMISAIEANEDFLEGGRIYFHLNLAQSSINLDNASIHRLAYAQDKKPMLQLFGLDDFPLSRIDVFEGELDFEKLASGKYIIEGIQTEDDGQIIAQSSNYKIGDKVVIHIDGQSYEYELLAKMRIDYYTNYTRYVITPNTMYLPSAEFKRIVKEPVVMSYAYNVEEGSIERMENFIQNYTTNIENTMSYDSKLTYIESFKSLQNTVILVGGILSFVIGFIGVLNFMNSMITSMNARKREFATLQSIGMTNKQLIHMLCLEGIYYAMLAILVSLILGVILSMMVVQGLISTLWMFSYHFTIIPILLVSPILLMLGIVIPYFSYHTTNKQSIVERLREVE